MVQRLRIVVRQYVQVIRQYDRYQRRVNSLRDRYFLRRINVWIRLLRVTIIVRVRLITFRLAARRRRFVILRVAVNDGFRLHVRARRCLRLRTNGVRSIANECCQKFRTARLCINTCLVVLTGHSLLVFNFRRFVINFYLHVALRRRFMTILNRRRLVVYLNRLIRRIRFQQTYFFGDRFRVYLNRVSALMGHQDGCERARVRSSIMQIIQACLSNLQFSTGIRRRYLFF